ncbi:HAMP domain-containing protein, partial [Candidatus Gottesmanbacteria bacterium]|nr:HAMP domain-containing protein [Candidatus Gottesmanbacteria bacterium]
MNTKSVRFRLTVWYALAFFTASIVIFASFYLITKRTLYSQTDITLESHGSKIVEVITREESKSCQSCQMMARDAFLREFSDIPGMVVILMDNTGNIVGSSVTVDRSDKKLSQLFEQVSRSYRPFITDHLISDLKMRFWIDPIYKNDQLLGVVFVGHPIDVIEKSLNNLLLMLGVIFIIFLIPTVFGGYLLAKSAIQPISSISEKLKKISSENLDERVTTPDTNDEIKELAVTFNSLLDRLSQAFKRERQFIGDLAHELKTPLTTQRSNIEVILAKDRDKKEYIKALSENLVDNHRMSATLDNILDLAWSKAEITIHFEIFNLSELVDEICDLATKMAFGKSIKIIGQIQPNIKIHGKRDKLFHAVLNIVDNAIKYTNDQGTVTVSLHKTSQKIHLQIKDNGIGIVKKELPHVFERFYRGAKNDKTSGSGLGLAIAEAIISSHHGKINIESNAGHGTS